jgi:hypothetical protein
MDKIHIEGLEKTYASKGGRVTALAQVTRGSGSVDAGSLVLARGNNGIPVQMLRWSMQLRTRCPRKSPASTITPTQDTTALLRGSHHDRFRPNDELRQLHQR